MDPNNPSGSHGGGGSSKGSTPDVKGKGSEILDGLHPRIETRGQSRRHEKKRDKKKGSKSSQSVATTSRKDDPSSSRSQADTDTVEDMAALPNLPQSEAEDLQEAEATGEAAEDPESEDPGIPDPHRGSSVGK
jgi:hypothetical protein